MKTQLSLALFILVSSQAFAQSAKIAASQKTSTSSSVRVSDQATASGSASTSAAANASGSASMIQNKSTEARQQLNATGDAAIEAKNNTESEIHERMNQKTEMGISSDAGAKATVKTNSSSDNVRIASNTNVSAEPAIEASLSGINRVQALQPKARGDVSTGLHVVSKTPAAINHEVKPVLNTNSNFKATQSNRVKMKPVSVRSKTMTATRVKL